MAMGTPCAREATASNLSTRLAWRPMDGSPYKPVFFAQGLFEHVGLQNLCFFKKRN